MAAEDRESFAEMADGIAMQVIGHVAGSVISIDIDGEAKITLLPGIAGQPRLPPRQQATREALETLSEREREIVAAPTDLLLA